MAEHGATLVLESLNSCHTIVGLFRNYNRLVPLASTFNGNVRYGTTFEMTVCHVGSHYGGILFRQGLFEGGRSARSDLNYLDEGETIGQLNRKLRGWANDFDLGTVSRAYDAVNYHVTNRLRRWLCRKHQVRGPGYSRYPGPLPVPEVGAIPAQAATPEFPVRDRVRIESHGQPLSESRMP